MIIFNGEKWLLTQTGAEKVCIRPDGQHSIRTLIIKPGGEIIEIRQLAPLWLTQRLQDMFAAPAYAG